MIDNKNPNKRALPGGHDKRCTVTLFLFTAFVLTGSACIDDGLNGMSSVFSFTELGPSTACPSGGVQVDSGLDDNNNGVLETGEITHTEILCQGNTGQAGAYGDDGAHGTDGADGADGTAGVDGTDGTDGIDELIVTTDLPQGDPNCQHGGIRVDVGIDDGDPGGIADNGILEPEEIDETQFICNGESELFGEPFDAPDGPPGAFTVDVSGGDGLNPDGGDGGHGGELTFEIDPGSIGGHIKLFSTGLADASFEFPPSVPIYLGDNPLQVTTAITVVSITDHTPLIEGAVHTHENDTTVYLRDSAGPGGHTSVTGIHITADGSLTFEHNLTTAPTAEIEIPFDFHNAGLLTVVDIPTTTSSGNLDLSCSVYLGESTSTIDLSGGDAGDGGDLTLETDAGFFNQGTILTFGGGGESGGYGGFVEIDAADHLFNTGDISANGGEATNGNGGEADEDGITLHTGNGNISNSGNLNASGANGTFEGGDAGTIWLYTSQLGTIRNSGNLIATGGNTSADCTVGCSGGAGAVIDMSVSGGGLINSGNLLANGGFGATGPGGSGGAFDVDAGFGSGRGTFVPPDDVVISGSINISGGDGADGGVAGTLEISLSALVVPQNQEIILLGYTQLNVAGGNGTANGGDGGDVVAEQMPSQSHTNAYPSGGVINTIPINASGGDGTSGAGGDGGWLEMTTESELGWQADWEVIVNHGSIDLSGGNGATAGGATNGLVFWGYNGVENTGSIDASGGHATDGTAGYGSSVAFFSDLGPVGNAAFISTDGGACTADAGSGAYAGDITLHGHLVDNTADLSAAGGDGGATSGTGGDGADVDFYSFGGITNAATSIDIGGGTGATAGNDGSFFVDGSDATGAVLTE